MRKLIESEGFGGDAGKLLVIANLVGSDDPKSAQGNELALMLDGANGISKSILFQIIFGLNFDGILLVGVEVLGLLGFLVLGFRLGGEEKGLRVAGERQGVELAGAVPIELVERGQLLELEGVFAALDDCDL